MAALAWLSAALPLAAQAAGAPERWSELADTVFRNYGADNDGPLTPAMAFAEDGDGFLWVGTQSGLARWDGYHFRIFRSDPADPKTLQNDFIWCLQPDKRGLWIGTNSGLSRYDSATNSFSSYVVGSSSGEPISVRSLAEDGSGGIWVGSDRGLDHLDAGGNVITHDEHDNSKSASLPENQVLALLRDHSGRLWVGTHGGLARLDSTAAGFVKVPLAETGETSSVRALLETANGQIWVGTKDQGLFSLDPSDQFTKAVHGNLPTLDRSSIQALAEIKPGTIWLGTDGKGIVALNAGTGAVASVTHDPTRSTSLSHDFVFSLYRDRSGLLWTGTYAGLGVHDASQDAIITTFGGVPGAKGLTGTDVLTTLAAQDGNIWVTYIGGGVDVLDPARHRLASLRSDPSHPQTSVPADRIRATAQSDDGKIYMGSYRGLYRIDPVTRNVVHLPFPSGTMDPRILSLLSDANGLWIGTYAEGLWRLDFHTGKLSRHANPGLSEQWISSLAAADGGQLWVGSYQGLFLFDPKNELTRRILPDPEDPRSKPSDLISSLIKDHRGRLWAATLGAGIAVLEGFDEAGKPRFRKVSVAEGLADSDVDSLVEDKMGSVWATAGNGAVSRIDSDTLEIQIFRRAEGVGLRGFGLNAGTITAQGEVLLGGDGGIIVIRPERIKPWAWRPPIAISELRVGGLPVPPKLIDESGRRPPLQVTPDANSLSVEFAALDYSAPDRNRYAYWLEGYDAGWVSTDSAHRLASYTNLPPHQYTLHLRGSNRQGAWTEATLDIPIEVLPAWHQTKFFRIAVSLMVILGVWALVRGRTAYLRHRQRILEDQVAQRTSELRLSNTELKTRTTELAQSLREIAESRAKVSNLLDTSGQGFLSFGDDLIIEPGCSRACAAMLGRSPEGSSADVVLFGEDPGKAELFRKVVSGALSSSDPFKQDLLFSLLPITVERRGRLLKVEYKRLDNGHVMVILTDITEEQRLSKKIDNERLRLTMIVMAVTESRDFFDAVEAYRQFFRQELMQVLAARAAPISVHQEIYRQVHTLKGVFAQFHFNAIPKMLHKLEESLTDLKREGEEIMTTGRIVELALSVDYHGALETDLDVLRDALGEEFLEHGKGIFLPMSLAKKLRDVAERLLAGDPLNPTSEQIRALFAQFCNLDKIELADALAGYDRVISQVAAGLNKEVASLAIESSESLWLDPELFGPFLRSLVHVFRNAVVHGIEDPEERLAKGKGILGRVHCFIHRSSSTFSLTITDDGAGIDTEALREKAVLLNLLSEQDAAALTEDEAVALIFADDVTVREKADELSGRGVGLAAVRAETEALGGYVVVTSRLGEGTSFIFSFPYQRQIPMVQLTDAENA